MLRCSIKIGFKYVTFLDTFIVEIYHLRMAQSEQRLQVYLKGLKFILFQTGYTIDSKKISALKAYFLFVTISKILLYKGIDIRKNYFRKTILCETFFS